MQNNDLFSFSRHPMNCPCCGASLTPSFQTPRMALQKCPRCGTFRAAHPALVQSADPWKSEGLTPAFMGALAERRTIQSKEIIRHFGTLFQSGLTLDYGCGQGAFMADLLAAGFEVMGCDLSRTVAGTIPPDRFIELSEPWGIPKGIDFKNVMLLDVLEHSPDPARFIARLKDRGARHFIVKVPLVNGPMFVAARMTASLGYPFILEKLFLAGDVSPHLLYFTSEGLIRLFQDLGFRCAARVRLVEIGKELPCRVRKSPAYGKAASALLSAAGLAAQMLSPLWADTGLFRFDLEKL